jgi:hypothetical protein
MKTNNSSKKKDSKNAKASSKAGKSQKNIVNGVNPFEAALAATEDTRKGHVVGSSGNGLA